MKRNVLLRTCLKTLGYYSFVLRAASKGASKRLNVAKLRFAFLTVLSLRPTNIHNANIFYPRSTRGVGLVEVVVGIGILTIVFVGFFGVLQLGTRLATDNKARTGALALALERMEFLRSLAYEDVGTLDGGDANNGHGNEPDGEDEGNPGHGGGLGNNYKLFSTHYEYITLNGVDYTRRTLIAYIDDEGDGTSGQDENHKRDDYKVVRVRVTWESPNGQREVKIVSNVTPLGIEE